MGGNLHTFELREKEPQFPEKLCCIFVGMPCSSLFSCQLAPSWAFSRSPTCHLDSLSRPSCQNLVKGFVVLTRAGCTTASVCSRVSVQSVSETDQPFQSCSPRAIRLAACHLGNWNCLSAKVPPWLFSKSRDAFQVPFSGVSLSVHSGHCTSQVYLEYKVLFSLQSGQYRVTSVQSY